MMATPLVPAGALQLAPVQRGPLLFCRVVIKMRDGSRGEHNGFYYHRLDALDRAMDLFPEAKVISVVGGKARMAAP